MRRFLTERNIYIIILIIIFVNLLYLDFSIQNPKKETQNNVTSPYPTTAPTCPDCETKINTLENKINALLTPAIVSPIPTQKPSSNITTQAIGKPSEYYVPFGGGSGNYSDWTSVPGLQAYIDSTSYGTLKSVVFEVSLHIPNGNQTASVRLLNTTDGRVVNGSQIDFNGNTQSVFLSSPIVLDYGQKLYVVQLKTQLGFTAVLDQSRIHITTK